MLLCRGKDCIWRKVCSRYVIGKAMKNLPVSSENEWMDHCLHHETKFIRMGNDSVTPPPRHNVITS